MKLFNIKKVILNSYKNIISKFLLFKLYYFLFLLISIFGFKKTFSQYFIELNNSYFKLQNNFKLKLMNNLKNNIKKKLPYH
jgi:hypothetical protein